MVEYRGFQIPEILQEIMLTANYQHPTPTVVLWQTDNKDNGIYTGITFKDLCNPELMMGDFTNECKKMIDTYMNER